MPDLYKADLVKKVDELARRVEQLEALLRVRPPLTHASRGWRFADMSIPSVDAGEIHVGSNDGEPFFATESGVRRLPALPGEAPAFPDSFTSPATIAGTPTAANYNALRADAAMLQVCQRDLITKGRTTTGSGLWLSS